MLSLDWPWLFSALPLPVLVYWLAPPAVHRMAAVRVPFFKQLDSGIDSSVITRRTSRRLPALVLFVIWSLLLLAASGPTWLGEPIALPSSGRDLLMAVDLSESMQIEDMQLQGQRVNRLIAVKAVLREFIKRREGDRLGLILFGSQAYLQAPLTFDRDTVAQFLIEAQIGFAGPKTAIGDAVGLAVKRLREREGDRHILILLTDGANTAGEVDPLTAARLAAENNITIYSIGVGADEMVTGGIFSRRVNPSVDLDEDTLRSMAESTGGQYFRARNPQQLLEIYHMLDRLEPVSGDEEVFRPEHALFYWPLGAALLLAFLHGIVPWLTRKVFFARANHFYSSSPSPQSTRTAPSSPGANRV